MIKESKRVAVIAVHGVADQQPGATGTAIADLLENLDTREGRAYGPFVERRIAIPVRRVDVPREPNASGTFEDRAPKLRHRDQTCMTVAVSDAAPAEALDVGLEFMSSLLADYVVKGPEETYDTFVFEGTRTAGPNAVGVDVYEMYWADLSRLTRNAFRVFTETFQLLAHLGNLGVHVVNAALASERDIRGPWRTWAWAQKNASDCLSIYVLLLNLVLLSLGIVLLPNALPTAALAPAAWIGAGLLAGGVSTYALFRAATRRLLVWSSPLLVAAAGVLFGATTARGGPGWAVIHARQVLTTEAFVVSTALIGVLVFLYDRRRPGAIDAAKLYFAPFSVFLLWSVWSSGPTEDDMITAVFRDIEAAYVGLVVSWTAFIVLSWVAFLAGSSVKSAARQTASGDRVARALWTARLTLAVPAALILMTTIVLWSLVWSVSATLLGNACYEPTRLFAWLLRPGVEHSANDFVSALIQNGAGLGFGPLVALMAVAAMLAVYALAPIAVTEVFPYRRTIDGSRTGVWLDHGFRLLRQAGRILVIAMLVVVPASAAIVVPRRLAGGAMALLSLNTAILKVAAALLIPAAAGLLTFGGRLKSLALGFRSIVDVALDVDNYLREHPIDSAPRARICARFASLLRYVYAQPYDAFIIVAHSQGTVITADLLRFIHRAGLEDSDGDLGRRGHRPISLFTMGSPLRQLYGLRFPHLYRWARHELTDAWTDRATKIGRSAVPDPKELNVHAWVNAYRSGDYIGRYLWRPERCTFSYDTVDGKIAQPWQIDAYQRAIASVTDDPVTRREFCIGAGAHTHYWDRTAPQIAAQLDQLITDASGSAATP